MAENNDPVVVEEEPEVQDSGPAIATSGGSKVMMIAIMSIFAAVIIYFFLFSSGGVKEDIVDPTAIIQADKADKMPNFNAENATIDSLLQDNNYGNEFIDNINNINPELPNIPTQSNDEFLDNLGIIPEIPTLPDELTDSINEEIQREKDEREADKEKEKGDLFTKDEVNKLINERLLNFQTEMDRVKNESQKLAEELKVQEESLKKEKKEKKEKKFTGLIPPTGSLNPGGSMGSSQESDTGKQTSGSSSVGGPPIGNTAAGGASPIGASGVSGVVSAGSSFEEEQKIKIQEEEKKMQQAKRVTAMEERRTSPMFKIQGGGATAVVKEKEDDSIIVLDKDLLVDYQDTENTVVPTKNPDLSRVILQGKVINAVLESSINTDLEAQVRAIVSRDIYAEYGKNILIPKGSRLVGTFKSTGAKGIARLGITWNRILRVDGLSINITASAADQLGRGGIEGDLDNKYTQIIGNSFLSSLMTITTALAVDTISKTSGISTSTGALGEIIQSVATPTDLALVDATESFLEDTQKIIDDIQEQKPTIRIPQGTKMLVIVNQDLNLPIYKKIK